jgi:hypothetical protein
MMFTGSPPGSPGDRVSLFFLADHARVAIGRGNPVFRVAVHYDALHGRLLPLEPVSGRPGWTASASPGDDVSVATTEPIPSPLYLVADRSHFRTGTPRPG